MLRAPHERQVEIIHYIAEHGEMLARAATSGMHLTDELKARMDQMQKQYEQRIEKMDLRLQKDGTDLLTPSMPSC